MTAKAKKRALAFLSYSHLDEEWKQLVLEQLGPVTGHVELWHDGAIEPGDEFHQEITNKLDEARIAICLISSNFLRSRYCLYREFGQLAERRGRGELELVPILVENCEWRDIPLVKLHLEVLNRVPVGDHALKDLTPQEIQLALSKVVDKVSRLAGERPIHRRSQRKSVIFPAERERISVPPNRFVLVGRELESAALEMAWNSDRTRVVSLVGPGGTGKTTLVRAWIDRMKAHEYRGAQRVFGWSFYSQGSRGQVASTDRFFQEFFEALGVTNIPPSTSSWDKGEQLARLLRRERTLLFLDGLEPLQADHEAERGRILDPGLRVLVEDFAGSDQGLCVITTRQQLADLESGDGGALMQIDIAEVQEEDGRDLLAIAKLKGTPEQLRAVSRAYGNHPLALRLLSGFLKEFHNRDAAAAHQLEPVAGDAGIAAPVERVLVNLERRASPQLIRFLRYIGLFARPCTLKELQAAGVDENTLADLRDTARSLYLFDEEDDRARGYVDMHPLLREYFREQFRQTSLEEWKDANYRLAGFFLNNAPPLPDSLSEMLPLFEAVIHGCRAGVFVKIFNQYYLRIERGTVEYQIYELGAHGLTLSALGEFFEKSWTKFADGVPDNDDLRAALLNRVGRFLKALGRSREAIEALTEALHFELAMPGNHENAGTAAENLAGLYLEQGNPGEALRYSEHALGSYESAVIAANGDDAKIKRVLLRQCGSVSTMAVCHWAMGETDRAKDAFDRMFALHQLAYMNLSSPPRPVTSTAGYRYGQFLLETGEWAEAFAQAVAVLNHAGKFADDRVRGDLLAAEVWFKSGQHEKAGSSVDRALKAALAFGDRSLIAQTMLARAECRSASRQHELARTDLHRAATIARRGGLKLLEVDALLASTKAAMMAGEIARARSELDRATSVIAQTGYTRAMAIANTMRLAMSAF